MTKYTKIKIRNSIHISFVIKGGKPVFGTCNLNGRNLSIVKNNSHLLISNSSHAECNAIANTFGFDNSKFKKKRAKFAIYSIAFKYSLNDNTRILKAFDELVSNKEYENELSKKIIEKLNNLN